MSKGLEIELAKLRSDMLERTQKLMNLQSTVDYFMRQLAKKFGAPRLLVSDSPMRLGIYQIVYSKLGIVITFYPGGRVHCIANCEHAKAVNSLEDVISFINPYYLRAKNARIAAREAKKNGQA